MGKTQLVFLVNMYLLYISHALHLRWKACNVSLTDSCSASLYFAPVQPKTTDETASLFHLNPNMISRTIDGFIIPVNCECPADHNEYISHIDYTIQQGDTWESVSAKFGSLVLEKREKVLIPFQTVTLDLLCGCSKGLELQLVTYVVKAGDTLYTICSRFNADLGAAAELNGLVNVELLHSRDLIFIPAKGLGQVILSNHDDSDTQNISRLSRHAVLAISAAVVTFHILTALIWCFCCCKRMGWKHLEASSSGFRYLPCFSTLFPSTPCKSLSEPGGNVHAFGNPEKATVFSYGEVHDATLHFDASQKLGQGSYGSVYLGRLRGTEVAIKQMRNTKSKEFLAELSVLCKVHHKNLVELVGYAVGGDSLFLVYEFAQNGALSSHLHSPGSTPIPWTTRVQIALDAARGLECIHNHYVHRDVKTSNILLDARFQAKIADFGLVKLIENLSEIGAATSKIVGTVGYLAPEYIQHGSVTPKIDVYAYGVVLMELITAKLALIWIETSEKAEYPEHKSLVAFMLAAALEDKSGSVGQLLKCVDPSLAHYHEDSLIQMALLAKECVDDDWNQRPDMSKVVVRLSQILECSMKWEVKAVYQEPLSTSPSCWQECEMN